MKRFWNKWSRIVLDVVWLTLLTVLGIFNIVTATGDNLYIWLLGVNFGLVCANLIIKIIDVRA